MAAADPAPRLCCRGWRVVVGMTRASLTGVDLSDWIALRRISKGHVVKLGAHWIQNGRRVPYYVADALAMLCEHGLVALADPDPLIGITARAVLTDTGATRYQQLCPRQTAR
jgi:hypothetical protein